MGKTKGRELKTMISAFFRTGELTRALALLSGMPPRRVVNPLFSLILSTDPSVKWAAVTAMGETVSRLADRDMESARVIMRRFMWQLNDESGGIGWGCPESMGETMALHEGLSREFSPVLVSYVNEEGNFLEYEPLLAGAVWGIGRVAQVRAHRVGMASPYLIPLLLSSKPFLRGLAVWTLGSLHAEEATSAMKTLLGDKTVIELYRNRELQACQINDLTREALKKMTVKDSFAF